MNNFKRFAKTFSTISRLGKISPTFFKNAKPANIPMKNIAKPATLPQGYFCICNKNSVETRINSVRIVNFNSNHLLLNNVYVLSGFGPSSLEELLENADDDEYF